MTYASATVSNLNRESRQGAAIDVPAVRWGLLKIGSSQRILAAVGFLVGTAAMLLFLVGVLLVVGRFYPGSNAELIDWHPTRSADVEAQNEIDDVRQMLEAQNEMRRRRGAGELTEEALNEAVAEDERSRLYWQGPFGAA